MMVRTTCVIALLVVSQAHAGNLIALDPFVGELSQGWEEFPNGQLLDPVTIFEGATLTYQSGWIYEPAVNDWLCFPAQVADGRKGFGAFGPDVLVLDLAQPIVEFGFYFADGGPIGLTFFDANDQVIGQTDPIYYEGQDWELQWTGWRSPRSVYRIHLLTLACVAMDSIQANRSPSGGCLLADVNDDGEVNVSDLLLLLAQWGPCPPKCIADIDQDGEVGILDLLILLGNWGNC